MKIFEHICLGTVSAAAAFLMIQAGLSIRAAQHDASKVTDSIIFTAGTVNGVTERATVIEDQVFDAAQKFSTQIAQQSADWQKAQLQVYKTITDTKEILVRTDRSLNDVLVPRLSAQLDSSTKLTDTAAQDLSSASARLNRSLDELEPGIENMDRASAAAAAAMSDPSIHETLAHVDGVSANLDATSSDIHAFVHRETTPVRGTWNVIKAFLQEFAGPLAQVTTAAK